MLRTTMCWHHHENTLEHQYQTHNTPQVTDYHMARNMEAEAVNGPTRSHGIKAFSWSDWSSTKYQHKGHPEVFNFEFERIGPHTAACAHPGVEHAFA